MPAVICRGQLEIKFVHVSLGGSSWFYFLTFFLGPLVKAFSRITDVPRRVEMFYLWAATELIWRDRGLQVSWPCASSFLPKLHP